MEHKSLITYLNEIEDTRHAEGKRHNQLSLIIIVIMAILCGKTSLKMIARFAKTHREELNKHIPLPRGKAPSYSTIQRLSHRLNAQQVCDAFNNWMSQYQQIEDIAGDGKSLSSTVKNANNSEQSFASLVSFFGQSSQLIRRIGILENNKESEIHVLQSMVDKLGINKALFTMDAIHCQKNTVKAIIDSGNDYLITVKRNQPKLHDAIAQKAEEKPIDEYSWKQTGHGHDSHCRIKVWDADENMKKTWTGLQHYISVRRYGVRNGKEFDMTTFYISSANRSAYRFAKAVRGHRKIENELHWTKDVIQNEDNCGLSDHTAAINMAVMRDIGFNLLVMNGFKSISDGIGAFGEKISSLWNVLSNEAVNLKNIFS